MSSARQSKEAASDRRKAGLFVIASAVLVVVMFGLAIGLRALAPEVAYFARFEESVSGLDPGSTVRCMGVPVGTVKSMRFPGRHVDQVVVELALDPDVPVKADTRAQLRFQGITGAVYLELTGGTSGAPALRPGGTIPALPSLSMSMTTALEQLAALVEKLDRMVGESGAEVPLVLRDVRAAVTTGEEALAEIRTTARDARTAVGSTFEQVDEALVAFRRIEASIAQVAAALSDITEDSRRDIAATLASLREASDHMEAAASEVRREPSLLLRARPAVEKDIPDPLPPLSRAKR